MPPRSVLEVVAGVCAEHGCEPPEVMLPGAPDACLSLRGGALVVPPWALRPLPVLHMLAHWLTPDAFPAHGVEFAATWLGLVREGSPGLARALQAAFEAEGVRHDPAVQARDVRRRLVDIVNNRPGELVTLTLADPVEELCGPLRGLPGLVDGAVIIGDERVELSRVRYESSPRRAPSTSRRARRQRPRPRRRRR